MPALFITSVGTGIGKTLVTSILCYQLTASGRAVRAIKPVISGFSPDDPASDPALILRSLGQASTFAAIAAIAPWRFAAPLSPHLAARREMCTMRLDDVAAFCSHKERSSDGWLLIEGAGGVMAPLDSTHTGLDLMARLGHPVVLVTGSYLGALSHTLTALCAVKRRDIKVRGIVVSESEPSAGLCDTAETIGQFAGTDARVYALPRLAGDEEQKWRAAPDLTALCAGAGL
jgi:dethiobiotin synthetase